MGAWILIGVGALVALWALFCLMTGRAPTGRGGVAYRRGAGAGSAVFYWIVTGTLCAVGFGNVIFGLVMLLFHTSTVDAAKTPSPPQHGPVRRGPR
jgi:hypothetical protein